MRKLHQEWLKFFCRRVDPGSAEPSNGQKPTTDLGHFGGNRKANSDRSLGRGSDRPMVQAYTIFVTPQKAALLALFDRVNTPCCASKAMLPLPVGFGAGRGWSFFRISAARLEAIASGHAAPAETFFGELSLVEMTVR